MKLEICMINQYDSFNGRGHFGVHINFVKIMVIMFHNWSLRHWISSYLFRAEYVFNIFYFYINHTRIKHIVEPRLSAFRYISCSISTRTVWKSYFINELRHRKYSLNTSNYISLREIRIYEIRNLYGNLARQL